MKWPAVVSLRLLFNLNTPLYTIFMDRNTIILWLLFLLGGITENGFGQLNHKANPVEKLISDVIDSSFNACVYIIEYDTLSHKKGEGMGFSGVVVSKDGHILTVSHAVEPHQVYLVTFPDGDSCIASGLGRIGIQKKGQDFDMAMIKILHTGKWRYAKMGRSADLVPGQPVVSISYPGSFYKPLPNIRLGKINHVGGPGGYIESTCKMEPGDSGGPLFDAEGRVVGLHSWIKANENENFDVPIDAYLKYWSALSVAKDYASLPVADMLPSIMPRNNGDSGYISVIGKTNAASNRSVVQIISGTGDKGSFIKGAVIKFGGKIYIVSKSSMVRQNPKLLYRSGNIPATILIRDRENDLILLTARVDDKDAVDIDAAASNGKSTSLGRLLFTPVNHTRTKVGISSSSFISMEPNYSIGFFGADATYIDRKVTITSIRTGSAACGFLRIKDQVISINDVSIDKPEYYGRELARCYASESIQVSVRRNGKLLQLKFPLPVYPTGKHVSYDFPGGTSMRSDGFAKVLIQDAAIRADECGSPVFNIANEFIGINIARHSRTSTVIMPVDVIVGFIVNSSKGQHAVNK